MMATPAWKSLNANQRAIYVEMAARYNGSNNGRIHFSTREAAGALHIGRATAGRELAVAGRTRLHCRRDQRRL
jgi:hypothetical protein